MGQAGESRETSSGVWSDNVWADALRGIDVGLIVIDKQSCKFLFVNDYATRVLDEIDSSFDLKELYRQTFKGQPVSAFGQVRTLGAGVKQVVHAGGKTLGLTVHDTPGPIAVTLLKDISVKSSFMNTASQNENTATMLTVFSQLRHELGNPLNSMKMTLQVLKENIETFSTAKINEYIARNINEIGRLEKLLASLRQIMAQDAILPHEVDLKSLVQGFARLVTDECRSENVSLEIEIDEEARFVLAELDSLRQILHNLLKNAREAKPPDATSLRVCITSQPAQLSGMVRIDFTDNGIGIPRHCLPLIYRPMYTTKPNGTGLGLALVERLTKRMNGLVKVTSEVGGGTNFQIYLPAGSQA